MPVPGNFACPKNVSLNFAPDTASACPMFAGRYIRNVKNGPSPKWVQDRLRAIGLQSDLGAGRCHQSRLL